jgi:hypothetical protein
MKVCQIKNAANLLRNLPNDKGVNFIVWRNTNYVTLTFMVDSGEVMRYRLYEDGTVGTDNL